MRPTQDLNPVCAVLPGVRGAQTVPLHYRGLHRNKTCTISSEEGRRMNEGIAKRHCGGYLQVYVVGMTVCSFESGADIELGRVKLA